MFFPDKYRNFALMEDINQLNIANLTALWSKVGQAAGLYTNENGYELSLVKNAEWPNKIWTKQPLAQELLTALTHQMASCEQTLVFPHWDIYPSKGLEIASEGFTQKSFQTGMSLQLNKSFTSSKSLTFKRVLNANQARLWAGVYPKCFGYVISEETLNRTMNEIEYHLFYFKDELVGTAIYYPSEQVAGIHGVGIVPEMRKRGFAEEIMCILLNRAIAAGIPYATLQASELGKGIYKRLGFTEDFIIRNYVR
ncbi:GNAT family N-acetyltransferase [Pedobacter nanyangensis]|uniref:GNAT family N-acetyltransferase n=1 Tax=Pedobacter nanyangensis TaxID=1562389 RepID=UPI000DE1E93A|nr:GNAT family N-acetyltransferase [Pedobacter nanyangensis]